MRIVVVPVLPHVPPQVFPVVPQVIAPVLSNIDSECNLLSFTIDLSKSSLLLLLLSSDLDTVVPCIHLSLSSSTAKIYVNTIATKLIISTSLDSNSIAPLAYNDLFASVFVLQDSIALPAFNSFSLAPPA